MAAFEPKADLQTHGLIATKLTLDGGALVIWRPTEIQRLRVLANGGLPEVH